MSSLVLIEYILHDWIIAIFQYDNQMRKVTAVFGYRRMIVAITFRSQRLRHVLLLDDSIFCNWGNGIFNMVSKMATNLGKKTFNCFLSLNVGFELKPYAFLVGLGSSNLG